MPVPAFEDRVDLLIARPAPPQFGGRFQPDGGLTFGASIDVDEQIGGNNADDGLGESGATRDDSEDGGACPC